MVCLFKSAVYNLYKGESQEAKHPLLNESAFGDKITTICLICLILRYSVLRLF